MIYGEFSWSGELSFRQTEIVPGEGNNKVKCKNNNSKNTQAMDRSAWHGGNVHCFRGPLQNQFPKVFVQNGHLNNLAPLPPPIDPPTPCPPWTPPLHQILSNINQIHMKMWNYTRKNNFLCMPNPRVGGLVVVIFPGFPPFANTYSEPIWWGLSCIVACILNYEC